MFSSILVLLFDTMINLTGVLALPLQAAEEDRERVGHAARTPQDLERALCAQCAALRHQQEQPQ